jgi:hypothetical protein
VSSTASVEADTKETKKMAKQEKSERAKRTENALEDGRWVMGKVYRRTVKVRKGKNAGKSIECTMKVVKDGFFDQDEKTWPTPTALTTGFVLKHCGAAEGTRRPASTFFGVDIPKSKKVQTRAAAKPKVAKPKKAAKPKAAAKPAPKAAAKPAAKAAAPAAKPAETKAGGPPTLSI